MRIFVCVVRVCLFFIMGKGLRSNKKPTLFSKSKVHFFCFVFVCFVDWCSVGQAIK